VIFFNNVGCLGMCGHGAIGVITTLAHLGRIAPGKHRLDTPVGIVTTWLKPEGTVSVENVPCWREAEGVRIEIPGLDPVEGDIAYGGNWFYLAYDHRQVLAKDHVRALTDFARRLRSVVNEQGHSEVDHVELLGPPSIPGAHAGNFVLCPGGAYDRSPCGTGTSAKLACLAAAGEWPENKPWVQEGILGTTFISRYRWLDQTQDRIIPTIQGAAYVTGESTLVLNERDPFCWGI
jgi:proline racemase